MPPSPGLVQLRGNPVAWLKLTRWLLAITCLLLTAGQGTPQTQPATSQPAAWPISTPATALPGVPLNANIAVIPIHGDIVGSTYDHLKYRLETSVKNGATMIVIELDTNGGQLEPALLISKLLRGSNVPTLAWINTRAYSAGILIASACDAIVMAPAASTGDCAPINIVHGQMQAISDVERAKILSPLLEEFNASATSHGYDMAIFQAMTILHAQLYEVKRRDTGEVRLVNQDDYRVMVKGEDYDQIVNEKAGPDKPVGLSMTLANPQEQGQWELVRVVHDGKTILTVSAAQAQAIGLSKAQVDTLNQLGQITLAQHVSVLPITWSQTAAYWLSLGWVRALLVVVMLLAAYFELQTPGVGLGGGIALAALVLLVAGPMMASVAQWWHLLLVLLGLGLLLMELFVTPGLGFAGAAGLIALFIGLTLMGVPGNSGAFNQPPTVWADRMQAAMLWMLVAILLSGVGFVLMTRYFGQIPFMNKLTLNASQPAMVASTANASAVLPVEGVAGDEVVGHGQIRPGDEGVVTAPLRPAGRARLNDQLVDVLSDGPWIDAGQRVRVIESAGNRIVVQHISTPL